MIMEPEDKDAAFLPRRIGIKWAPDPPAVTPGYERRTSISRFQLIYNTGGNRRYFSNRGAATVDAE